MEHAAPAHHRAGELRVDPRPAAGRHAVHRGEAQPGRGRDARGHQARHGRLPAELRREAPGAPRPARQVPQPAGQRLGGDRRRDGHEHPAAQPGRGLRRGRRPDRQPGDRARRAPGDHPRPRLPHGGDDPRPLRHPRGLPDRPGPGHPPRQVRHRGAEGRPVADHLHRDPLPAHQGAAPEEAGRAGPHRPGHRRDRHPGRERPQAAGPDRREGQEGGGRQRRPQPALPVLAAAGHLQRHHAGPGRRPAPDPPAEGVPPPLRRAPPQRHPAQDAVPAPPGAGPRPHPRRPAHRPGLHRRDHPGDPLVGQPGRGPRPPDGPGGLGRDPPPRPGRPRGQGGRQPDQDAGRRDPGDAAPAVDRPGGRQADRRIPGPEGRHRRLRGACSPTSG